MENLCDKEESEDEAKFGFIDSADRERNARKKSQKIEEFESSFDENNDLSHQATKSDIDFEQRGLLPFDLEQTWPIYPSLDKRGRITTKRQQKYQVIGIPRNKTIDHIEQQQNSLSGDSFKKLAAEHSEKLSWMNKHYPSMRSNSLALQDGHSLLPCISVTTDTARNNSKIVDDKSTSDVKQRKLLKDLREVKPIDELGSQEFQDHSIRIYNMLNESQFGHRLSNNSSGSPSNIIMAHSPATSENPNLPEQAVSCTFPSSSLSPSHVAARPQKWSYLRAALTASSTSRQKQSGSGIIVCGSDRNAKAERRDSFIKRFTTQRGVADRQDEFFPSMTNRESPFLSTDIGESTSAPAAATIKPDVESEGSLTKAGMLQTFTHSETLSHTRSKQASVEEITSKSSIENNLSQRADTELAQETKISSHLVTHLYNEADLHSHHSVEPKSYALPCVNISRKETPAQIGNSIEPAPLTSDLLYSLNFQTAWYKRFRIGTRKVLNNMKTDYAVKPPPESWYSTVCLKPPCIVGRGSESPAISGAQTNCHMAQSMRDDSTFFILDPQSSKYLIWMTFVSMAVVYNLWTPILRQGFREIQNGHDALWIVLDLLADLLYFFDVFVQLRTSYLERGLTVLNRAKLFKRYVRSRCFLFDIVSLLPLDLLQFEIGIQPMIRFPRFLKAYRAWEWKVKVENQSVFPNLWRVTNLTHILFLGCHWFAAFYYLLSEHMGFKDTWGYPKPEGPTATVARKYLQSFYWATLTLTTIGDIDSPQGIEQ